MAGRVYGDRPRAASCDWARCLPLLFQGGSQGRQRPQMRLGAAHSFSLEQAVDAGDRVGAVIRESGGARPAALRSRSPSGVLARPAEGSVGTRPRRPRPRAGNAVLSTLVTFATNSQDPGGDGAPKQRRPVAISARNGGDAARRRSISRPSASSTSTTPRFRGQAPRARRRLRLARPLELPGRRGANSRCTGKVAAQGGCSSVPVRGGRP
jgi:hypothetical protein